MSFNGAIKGLAWRLILMGALAMVIPFHWAHAQDTQFKQAVAEAAATDADIAAFYNSNGYEPIWTGSASSDKDRRQAFLNAIQDVDRHGLPTDRYHPETLGLDLRMIVSDRERGRLEVEMSRLFLRYARDVQTGILTPSRIDEGLVRKVPYRPRDVTLTTFSKSSPKQFIQSLPPESHEYARLMKAKMQFERLIGQGGWGAEAPTRTLRPGDVGRGVVQLRDRLVRMGYMRRNARATYDEAMIAAVTQFQRDHGLADDGVAGPSTLSQVNVSPETRLSQIIVAMERERWLNTPLGKRHVLVNITDYQVRVVDDGKVTFKTRSVVGKNTDNRRTPEFSDVMDHMVINPTWYVPRSIATREYLPLLKQNPFAVSNLNVVDAAGRVVNRAAIDFTRFDENTFPFDMREPPSQGNALGLVKFMFPNQYNIYLHDTPAKSLFGREKRDFSHGCIRLNDPFEFAYHLLARQERNPEAFFRSALATGNESYVNLKEPVPVHIVYRTAFTEAKGNIQFRGDVYGRDAKIWRALRDAGVAFGSVQG